MDLVSIRNGDSHERLQIRRRQAGRAYHRKGLLRMRVRDRIAEHVVIAAAQRIANVRFVREGHCPAVELYTHTRGAAQVADILQQSV